MRSKVEEYPVSLYNMVMHRVKAIIAWIIALALLVLMGLGGAWVVGVI